MSETWFNWCLSVVLVLSVTRGKAEDSPTLIVTQQVDRPVLTIKSPGAEGNKYGFEGGRVLKLDDTYHLFTSEMTGDPHWVKMRLAHWTSRDRLHWTRRSTLFESSGDFTGKDPRAALWSPMPVFDDQEGRWNLFYVAYHCAPDTSKAWLTNHQGRIWRAVSKVKGIEGIDGPYQDVGIVLQPGRESDAWEGLQGTDSFFPFKVRNHWYAFYGTAHTETQPISGWQVGLASAPCLSGPWKRLSEMNPLKIEDFFIENPIVSTLPDGTLMAIYDNHAENAIGYAFSRDGIHWSRGKKLVVQNGNGVWAVEVRTPLGLIEESDGRFTLFYTANQVNPGTDADSAWVKTTPGALGMVEVTLERANSLSSRIGSQ